MFEEKVEINLTKNELKLVIFALSATADVLEQTSKITGWPVEKLIPEGVVFSAEVQGPESEILNPRTLSVILGMILEEKFGK